jgi:hypothetical protein
MVAPVDFSDYLNAIRHHYAKWWELYTLSDAVGKERPATVAGTPFDFGLMVALTPFLECPLGLYPSPGGREESEESRERRQ